MAVFSGAGLSGEDAKLCAKRALTSGGFSAVARFYLLCASTKTAMVLRLYLTSLLKKLK